MKKILIAFLGILLIGSVLVFAFDQNVTVTVLPGFGILKVFSPQNRIYSETRIPFNLSTDRDAKIIEYTEDFSPDSKFRRLCKDCDEYGFFRKITKSFPQGWHNLTFRATDYQGSMAYVDVSFFIDNRPPRITSTSPKRNGFANGTFEVEFIEENPKDVILYFGNSTGTKNKTLDVENDCEGERGRYICSIDVDPSFYEGKVIEYYFFVRDKANQTDQSRPVRIIVDTKPPEINEFNSHLASNVIFWHKNRISFFFNITEPNLDKITYIDHEDKRERERTLCTRLKDGICEKTKYFVRGEHNLTIYILDEAGNFAVIEPVEFVINP